jgi:hypothetical protein
MVPIYSVDSWLSLSFKDAALYLDMLRDCYEVCVCVCTCVRVYVCACVCVRARVERRCVFVKLTEDQEEQQQLDPDRPSAILINGPFLQILPHPRPTHPLPTKPQSTHTGLCPVSLFGAPRGIFGRGRRGKSGGATGEAAAGE